MVIRLIVKCDTHRLTRTPRTHKSSPSPGQIKRSDDPKYACLDVHLGAKCWCEIPDFARVKNNRRVQWERCLAQKVFTRARDFMINKCEKINRWSIECVFFCLCRFRSSSVLWLIGSEKNFAVSCSMSCD